MMSVTHGTSNVCAAASDGVEERSGWVTVWSSADVDKASACGVLQAVCVWIQKPQVCHRRLYGSTALALHTDLTPSTAQQLVDVGSGTGSDDHHYDTLLRHYLPADPLQPADYTVRPTARAVRSHILSPTAVTGEEGEVVEGGCVLLVRSLVPRHDVVVVAGDTTTQPPDTTTAQCGQEGGGGDTECSNHNHNPNPNPHHDTSHTASQQQWQGDYIVIDGASRCHTAVERVVITFVPVMYVVSSSHQQQAPSNDAGVWRAAGWHSVVQSGTAAAAHLLPLPYRITYTASTTRPTSSTTSPPANTQCSSISIAVSTGSESAISASAHGQSTTHLQQQLKWLTHDFGAQLLKFLRDTTSLPTAVDSKPPSLRLVDVGTYWARYQRIKRKYAKHIISMWTERTDPEKFVHEDLAIAAYLLTVWEERGLGRQRFVDLGCGNGLLVYILVNEGHTGHGIDLRARKLWAMYGENVSLKISNLTPIECQSFPDCQWILGNHSDELTPWIPYIAARSNYACEIFLLPCCAHDLYGKYNRRGGGGGSKGAAGGGVQSVYSSYLAYIEREVCEQALGFLMVNDMLRIPSTKRYCMMSKGRCYPEQQYEVECERRCQALLLSHSPTSRTSPRTSRTSPTSHTSRTSCTSPTSSTSPTSPARSEWKARAASEVVRNCTQVEREVRERVISHCMRALTSLHSPHTPHAPHGTNNEVAEAEGRQWNVGGCVSLGELAGQLDSEVKCELRRQCGGLQTLLRNHRYYFTVSRGMVTLRPLREHNELVSGRRVGQPRQPCYYHLYHPDACPYPAHLCWYRHDQGTA